MKKRSYLFVFVSFILFYVFMPVVHADNSGTVYKVDANNLTVREAPDHDSKVIGYLQSGDQVTVFQEKYGWIQTYYGGKKGWVASQYLYETGSSNGDESASESTSNSVTITTDSAHLRTGAGTGHDIAGFASKGDSFLLIDTKGNWLQVDAGNGSPAWVASWVTDQGPKDKPSDNEQAADATEKEDANVEVTNTSSNHSDSQGKGNGDTSSSKSLAGYNIMLDPGHGGTDPGAISLNGENEADIALDITQMVAEKLRDEGATVLLTRTSNSFVSLEDRMRINDAYMMDAFISLHLNASNSDAGGVSTHYYENGSDKALAQSIQNALGNNTNMRDRGISQDNYHVLRENSTDSVLVELGFITNPYDLETIHNPENTAGVANAIANGLKNYFH